MHVDFGLASRMTHPPSSPLMIAKMKCSSCGAEMSNLSMTWPRKYWLFMIPVMVLGFLPLIRMTFFKGDYTRDLHIQDVQKRSQGSSLEILGLIENTGGRTWSSVTVEAEFFDASGAFIDEEVSSLRSDVAAHGREHFKITVRSPSSAILASDVKMQVKVSGGHTLPF